MSLSFQLEESMKSRVNESTSKVNAAATTTFAAPIFEKKIMSLIKQLQPNEQHAKKRMELIERLNQICKSTKKTENAECVPFGSFVSNLYSPKSDLDISLLYPYEENFEKKYDIAFQKNALHCFKRALPKNEFSNIELIASARIPILMFYDFKRKLSCDISVNNFGFLNSRIFKMITEMDPRCRDLIYIVKLWAKNVKINDPKNRTLNSYAITNLVIFHLQTLSRPILPPLKLFFPIEYKKEFKSGPHSQEKIDFFLSEFEKKISFFVENKFGNANKASVSELFISFISQYSSEMSLFERRFSISTFSSIWNSHPKTKNHLHHEMIIEDPLEKDDNCARSVKFLSPVKFAFTETNKIIKNILGLGATDGQEIHFLLAQLFDSPNATETASTSGGGASGSSRSNQTTPPEFLISAKNNFLATRPPENEISGAKLFFPRKNVSSAKPQISAHRRSSEKHISEDSGFGRNNADANCFASEKNVWDPSFESKETNGSAKNGAWNKKNFGKESDSEKKDAWDRKDMSHPKANFDAVHSIKPLHPKILWKQKIVSEPKNLVEPKSFSEPKKFSEPRNLSEPKNFSVKNLPPRKIFFEQNVSSDPKLPTPYRNKNFQPKKESSAVQLKNVLEKDFSEQINISERSAPPSGKKTFLGKKNLDPSDSSAYLQSFAEQKNLVEKKSHRSKSFSDTKKFNRKKKSDNDGSSSLPETFSQVKSLSEQEAISLKNIFLK